MPPRSKSSKVEWITCSLCYKIFSNKDQTKHSEECNDQNPSNPLLSHGYIHNDRLYGMLTSAEAAVDKLPGQFHDNILYMHPGAMKLCGCYLGGPVVVERRLVLTAWPNAALPLTGVAIPSAVSNKGDFFCVGDQLRISSLSEPYLSAAEVTVIPKEIKPYSDSSEFAGYIKRQECGKFVCEGNQLAFSYFGQPCTLTVSRVTGHYNPPTYTSSCTPMPVRNLAEEMEGLNIEDRKNPQENNDVKFYKISESSQIIVQTAIESDHQVGASSLTSMENVGGLEKQTQQIQELIELQLNNMSLAGFSIPKGVLLYGPSGTGKTLLAEAIVSTCGAHVIKLHGAEVWSKYYGETESKLGRIFREAKERAPSIVLINDIDSLCPRRDSSDNDIKKRVVAALLSHMDDVFSHSLPVMVLATVHNPDDLDPSVRRPGRLDREIEIGVPTAKDRADVVTNISGMQVTGSSQPSAFSGFVEKLLIGTPHTLGRDDIVAIATKAHGFVGADLSAVCKEAGVHAFKRNGFKPASLSVEDLAVGLQRVQPSAMREVALEVPEVTWSDIGGQADLKHKLRQAIEWPLLHPESFARLGIRPPRGLLMYGPPGCSKTMIAKALARESGINFIAIKGPELFSKWVGESERAVREVFRKARAAAPAIIFFDEIDALAGERGSHGGGGGEVSDRVLAQLLTEIDGVDALQDVTIVAATNRPDRMDKALLRPGRLDRIVYVPLPDTDTRREIFTIQFRKTPTSGDVSLDDLVQRTEGYSGAEVAAVCHEAALSAMQENIDIVSVSQRHFDAALITVTPRITPDLIQFYRDYQQSSGLHSI